MSDSANSSTENTEGGNISVEVFPTSAGGFAYITVSPGRYYVLINVFAFFSIVAGIPGIAANILIVLTYTKMGITNSINASYTAMAISDLGCVVTTICTKMGITNSINASYTAMAISDLGCVVTTIWFEILWLPQMSTSESLPFIPLEFIVPSAAYPNMGFAKITACITAYISLERCLCVAFPHKVKLMFTKRLTVTVLIVIVVLNVIPAGLISFTHKLAWKDSTLVANKTVIGIDIILTPTALTISTVLFWLYGIVYQWAPASVTVVCSIFLAVHLRAGAKWRNKSLQNSNAEDKTNLKEDRIEKTVLMISVLSIILSAPVSINFILALVAPHIFPSVFFVNSLGTVLGSFATSMTMLNSCFNLLIYYRLGTKFRETLRRVLKINPEEVKQ